jgi:hypothetical protein
MTARPRVPPARRHRSMTRRSSRRGGPIVDLTATGTSAAGHSLTAKFSRPCDLCGIDPCASRSAGGPPAVRTASSTSTSHRRRAARPPRPAGTRPRGVRQAGTTTCVPCPDRCPAPRPALRPLRRAHRRAASEGRLHDLRHGQASPCSLACIVVVSKRLGHSSVAIPRTTPLLPGSGAGWLPRVVARPALHRRIPASP